MVFNYLRAEVSCQSSQTYSVCSNETFPCCELIGYLHLDINGFQNKWRTLSSLACPTSSCSYAIPGVISQNSKSQGMASKREVWSSVFQVPHLNLLHKGLNSKAPREEIRMLGFQSLVLGRKESGTCFMLPYSVRNFSAQITNSAYNSMYNILSGYEAAGSRDLSLR